MVKNARALARFELEQARRSPPDPARNRRIFAALWREAQSLGVIRRRDPLEGIEVVIRLARAVNRV